MRMLKESQLKSYSNFLYKKTGINISEAKKETFEIKIQKLMRRNNISSYDEYFKIISNEGNKSHIQEFINTITTNTTEFFREVAHFEYIEKNIEKILADIPRIEKKREIRVWCAASSSGQEPVTAAMVLRKCSERKYRYQDTGHGYKQQCLKKGNERPLPGIRMCRHTKTLLKQIFFKNPRGISAQKRDFKTHKLQIFQFNR